MWLFSAAASLFVAAPVALTATWQVPRGTKISRNISLKSIFRLFREIYFSERKIVTLHIPHDTGIRIHLHLLHIPRGKHVAFAHKSGYAVVVCHQHPF